ncbi:hypothetical protein GAR05_01505 [Micromonospora saelicesensis]|uniref:Uncharacterized protein n=1 Tax=Micromonospora saelicesensis TaxID=285676 RepID=A0ABX9CM34_9ACTN|nr:hypothetical protein GAR05_01505 [Micromonospora saelicesensis]RAO57157.1 hypothetical protein LUPAC06_03345 [Micromonospora saelicesensis]
MTAAAEVRQVPKWTDEERSLDDRWIVNRLSVIVCIDAL